MNTPEQSLSVYKENRIKNDIRSIVEGLDATSSIYKKWKKDEKTKSNQPEKISEWIHPPSDKEDPRFDDVMEQAKNSPIFQPSLPAPWAIIDSNTFRPLTVFATLEKVKKNGLLIKKGTGSTYIHNPLVKLTESENRVKKNLLGENFAKILVTEFTLGEDVLKFYDATLIKQYQVVWMYEAPLEGDCIIGGKREILYRVMMLE